MVKTLLFPHGTWKHLVHAGFTFQRWKWAAQRSDTTTNTKTCETTEPPQQFMELLLGGAPGQELGLAGCRDEQTVTQARRDRDKNRAYYSLRQRVWKAASRTVKHKSSWGSDPAPSWRVHEGGAFEPAIKKRWDFFIGQDEMGRDRAGIWNMKARGMFGDT